MSGMEPHAKIPPSPVLSPEVTVTQALELLASVSARTHFRVQTQNFWWNQYQHHKH